MILRKEKNFFFLVILILLLSSVFSIDYFELLIQDRDGHYGEKGVYSEDNSPPQRDLATSFTPEDRNSLYLFGGHEYFLSHFSDMWQYEIVSNRWRWIGGPNLTDQPEVCVQEGQYNLLNVPMPRLLSAGLTTSEGTFVIIGGFNTLHWKSEWQWRRNRETTEDDPVYGTTGEYNSQNHPRRGYGFNYHSLGNFEYISVHGAVSSEWYMTQIWKYSTTENSFAYLKGLKDDNDFVGNYNNEKGMQFCNQSNYPPSRGEGLTWLITSVSGDAFLYFYGGLWYKGEYIHDVPLVYWRSDLWKYDLSTNIWCWVGGNKFINYDEVMNQKYVYSQLNVPSRTGPSNTWVDATQSLLFAYSGFLQSDFEHSGSNEVWVYQINTGEWKMTNGSKLNEIPSSNIPPRKVGSSSWFISTTEVYFFGGINMTDGLPKSFNDLWKYTKNEYFCDDIDRDDPFICSAHGTCLISGNCDCESGYSGTDCSYNFVRDDLWVVLLSTIIPGSVLIFLIILCIIFIFVIVIYMNYMKKYKQQQDKINPINKDGEAKFRSVDYGTVKFDKKDKKTQTKKNEWLAEWNIE